jgi:glutamate 5-kinase
MDAARPRTCVIKIGSAVLAPGGHLSDATLARLAGEIAAARSGGTRIVLVSSGAVACGLAGLGMGRMPARISDRQAAAAVGQPLLMRAWTDALAGHGVTAAQVLLTAEDIDFRARFVNAHRTLETLLGAGVVPIINENDSVSFDEIKLGDNDRLSALASGLVGADLLLMLSVADGLREDGGAGPLIAEIADIADAARHVGDARSETGVGGMATKLDAARTASEMGADVVIAGGADAGAIARAFAGDAVGTRLRARDSGEGRVSRRKRWIAHSIRSRGSVTVDEGARRALVERGASLLPTGIVAVDSDDPAGFGIGAAVDVRTDSGVFARGLVAYRSDEIARIAGRPSDAIEGALGYTYCDEVIHRDDLILTENR